MISLSSSAYGEHPSVAERGIVNGSADNIKATILTDPSLAVEQAQALQGKIEKTQHGKWRVYGIVSAMSLRGEGLLRLGKVDEAYSLIEAAYSLVRKWLPNSKIEGDILLTRGGINGDQGNINGALTSYQHAHQIFVDLVDTRGQAKSLLSISTLYDDANDYSSALKYIKQAIDIYDIDESLTVAIYNNAGSAFEGLSKYRDAEHYYGKALIISRKLNSPLLEATILANSASVQAKANRLDAATASLSKAFRLTRDPEAAVEQPQLVAIAAQVALQRHDYWRARALIESRFAGLDLAETDLPLRQAHQTAFETYRALGQPELAIMHLMAVRRIEEQATKLATSASTALLAARFDYANQELRIANLKADDLRRNIALEHEWARFQVYVFAATLAVIAVVIAALAFALMTLRRSSRRVQAAHDDLAKTNVALGKALATKTEFLATTSHEIRTPLNGILGMTQVMLADRSLAPDVRERLTVVHGAGETMRALVDDILDVAKIETGNLTVERMPFDLRVTITTAVRLWEDQARSKGLTFVTMLDDCPAMIEGDAVRVRQIVFNLLSNAMKFTQTGEVVLGIAVDDACYRIVVRDTGIGIPADKLEQIFETFRQADTSTTREFGGTGLGLAICRSLAHAMGGEIAVDSAAGKGATFTVTLPLIVAVPMVLSTMDSMAQGPTLLVVDRSPIARSMFQALLSTRTDAIAFAADWHEIAGKMKNETIAQVLIDETTLQFQGDTLECLRQIASSAIDAGVRTVLLRASRASALTEDVLYATGIDVILTRPLAGETLVAALFDHSFVSSANRSLVSHAA